MTLQAFGSDATTLLVTGGAGGLVRGLIVLRKLLGTTITSQALITTGLDMGTSVIIGAIFAVFGSQITIFLVTEYLPANPDQTFRVATAGFLSGLLGITIATFIVDTKANFTKLKTEGK